MCETVYLRRPARFDCLRRLSRKAKAREHAPTGLPLTLVRAKWPTVPVGQVLTRIGNLYNELKLEKLCINCPGVVIPGPGM